MQNIEQFLYVDMINIAMTTICIQPAMIYSTDIITIYMEHRIDNAREVTSADAYFTTKLRSADTSLGELISDHLSQNFNLQYSCWYGLSFFEKISGSLGSFMRRLLTIGCYTVKL
jgi:hypothetical protein